ncbi:MAG: hypothetical protein EOM54_10905 [Clostridia bacterium]|nr:hypothetical protein [Clostridia bacterium]
MKRTAFFCLTLALLLALTACGSTPAAQKTAAPGSETVEPEALPTEALPEAAYDITYQNARAWTNGIGTTWVQVIVEITNTGSVPLYLSSGSYDLEDTSGKLIASQTLVSTYPNVLDVGEKGYMYEETTLDNVSSDTELVVVPRVDAEAATVDLIRYPVTDLAISDGQYGGIDALGRVENTADEAESMVYIAVMLFDADNMPIGLLFTILTDDLNPGDKIGFEANSFSLPGDVTAASAASYIVYSYPLQYQF